MLHKNVSSTSRSAGSRLSPVPSSAAARFESEQKAAIWREYHRLASHTLLSSSPSLFAILKFCLEMTLASRTSELKEYTIAVQVLNRRASFDPRVESIVRTQIGKLRKRLAQIYEEQGTPLGIRLSFATGSYHVQIETSLSRQAPESAHARLKELSRNIQKQADPRPLLLVVPPQTISPEHPPEQELSALTSTLMSEILFELAGFDSCRIARGEQLELLKEQTLTPDLLHRLAGVDFILDVLIHSSEESRGVLIQLIDAASGVQCWSIQVNAATGRPPGEARLIAARIAESAAEKSATRATPASETVASSHALAQSALRNALFHLRQMNLDAVNRALDDLDRASLIAPTQSDVEMGRILSLLTRSFLANLPSLHSRARVRLAVVRLCASMPSQRVEIPAITHLVDALYDWTWPDPRTVGATCQPLAASQSLLLPYYAFFVALPLGLVAEAEELLAREISLRPANPTARAFLGWLRLAQGDTELAEQDFLGALDIEPRCSYATEGLSRLRGQSPMPNPAPLSTTVASTTVLDLSGNPLDPAQDHPPLRSTPPYSAFWHAAALAQEGHMTGALAQLGIAIRLREARTLSATFDPLFSTFRSTPQFASILATMKGNDGP